MASVIVILLAFFSIAVIGLSMLATVINYYYDKEKVNKMVNKNLTKTGFFKKR